MNNILLIESDKVLGEASKSALETAGYEVTWKRSAQAGLDALDDTLPDLIILELQLGIHNGVEFLYELYSYPEWKHVPVVIHTINAQSQDEIFRQSLQQLGVRKILYKPRTTTAQLVGVVNSFVPA